MTMTRIFGKQKCDMCGLPSRLGWLYVCVQDYVATLYTEEEDYVTSQPIEIRELNDTEHQMRSLRVSQSIVDQYRAGAYSPSQVVKIINQRRLVKEAIKEATTPQQKVGSPTIQPGAPCTYKCCPHCRPFFLDRLCASIDSVCNGDELPITDRELEYLHVLNANILKHLDYTPRSTKASPHCHSEVLDRYQTDVASARLMTALAKRRARSSHFYEAPFTERQSASPQKANSTKDQDEPQAPSKPAPDRLRSLLRSQPAPETLAARRTRKRYPGPPPPSPVSRPTTRAGPAYDTDSLDLHPTTLTEEAAELRLPDVTPAFVVAQS